MRENIFKWCNWQGLNFQNIQIADTVQYHKTKQHNPKNGQNTLIDVFPKKIYRWPTGAWKDAQYHWLLEKCESKLQCGMTSHRTSHRSELPSSRSLQIINSGEGVEKRESLDTYW